MSAMFYMFLARTGVEEKELKINRMKTSLFPKLSYARDVSQYSLFNKKEDYLSARRKFCLLNLV